MAQQEKNQQAKKRTPGEGLNQPAKQTLLVKKIYKEVQRDFVTVIHPVDAVPSAEERRVIRKTVDAWLAGRVTPVREISRGTNDAITRKARVRDLVVDPKTGEETRPRQYRYVEVRLADEHLVSATLWPGYEGASYVEGATELPSDPIISVIAHDGSGVHLPVAAADLEPAEAAGKTTAGE